MADDTTAAGAVESPDDLPTELTRLLRNLDGVHTVYATKSLVPTVATAIVELVKSDPVGVHLVTVTEGADGREIVACVGIMADEPAPVVCRRVHDALRQFFVDRGFEAPSRIRVSVGRVG